MMKISLSQRRSSHLAQSASARTGTRQIMGMVANITMAAWSTSGRGLHGHALGDADRVRAGVEHHVAQQVLDGLQRLFGDEVPGVRVGVPAADRVKQRQVWRGSALISGRMILNRIWKLLAPSRNAASSRLSGMVVCRKAFHDQHVKRRKRQRKDQHPHFVDQAEAF